MWEGRAIENLGRTLSGIGGDFGTLALRAQKLAIHNEASDAIQTDLDAIREFELELKTKNENPLQWGDVAEKKMQELSTNRKFKTEASRNFYDDWSKKHTSKLTHNLTIAGGLQELRNYRGNLNLRIAGYVESGDFDTLDKDLAAGIEAGAITPDQAAATKEAAEYSYVDKKAMELVRTQGEDLAVEFINQQSEILDAGEQSKLIGKMGTIAKNLEADFDRFSEEKQREAIGNLFGKVVGVRPQLGHNELDAALPAMTSPEQRAWNAIVQGMSKVNSKTKTDYKKAIELEMKIFDHWAGLDKSEGDKRSILTEFATARYADRYLDDGYWQRLNEWLQLEIPPQNIGNLRASFKEIDRSINRMWLTKGEAKEIAVSRGALVRWYLDERLARKKETTEEDFIVKARRLGAMFLGPKQGAEESLPMPKTEEEYNALPMGTVYIHPDLGRMTKQ
jgi:hypothetical protein